MLKISDGEKLWRMLKSTVDCGAVEEEEKNKTEFWTSFFLSKFLLKSCHTAIENKCKSLTGLTFLLFEVGISKELSRKTIVQQEVVN